MTEEEYNIILKRVLELMRANVAYGTAEGDELDRLTLLIEEYEERFI